MNAVELAFLNIGEGLFIRKLSSSPEMYSEMQHFLFLCLGMPSALVDSSCVFL
jgi:hypothetical protein